MSNNIETVNSYSKPYSSTIITIVAAHDINILFKCQKNLTQFLKIFVLSYVSLFLDNVHSYGLHKLGKSINSFYDGLFPRQISFRRNSLKSFCKSSRHIMHSARSIFDAVSNLHRVSH